MKPNLPTRGISLKVEANGSIRAGGITITGPRTAGVSSQRRLGEALAKPNNILKDRFAGFRSSTHPTILAKSIFVTFCGSIFVTPCKVFDGSTRHLNKI
jgi:hypothetical protein